MTDYQHEQEKHAAERDQRIHDLEILVLVYEATVYCMLPFFKRSKLPSDLMMTQVSACADAHAQTMGEPAMYAEQVPPYVPKPIPGDPPSVQQRPTEETLVP